MKLTWREQIWVIQDQESGKLVTDFYTLTDNLFIDVAIFRTRREAREFLPRARWYVPKAIVRKISVYEDSHAPGCFSVGLEE